MKDRVGEEIINNRGEQVRIIAYRKNNDIDVLIDGKILLLNKHYRSFVNKQLYKPICRVGEKYTTNEGYNIEIIEYFNNTNCTIEFEDKTVIKKVYFCNIKTGNIKKPTNRVGEKVVNCQGIVGQIVKYIKNNNIDVEFEDGYIAKGQHYSNFKIGAIRSLNFKSVFGVGYYGEGYFYPSNNTAYKKFLNLWVGMLRRCYYDKYHSSHSYKDVTVCEEWHNFQNFAKWCQEVYKNYMKNWDLDKDIICPTCRVYSPDTCTFVPREINSWFKKNTNASYRIKKNGHYEVDYIEYKKKRSSRVFKNKNEALEFLELNRKEYLKSLANNFKELVDIRVYNILIKDNFETTNREFIRISDKV